MHQKKGDCLNIKRKGDSANKVQRFFPQKKMFLAASLSTPPSVILPRPPPQTDNTFTTWCKRLLEVIRVGKFEKNTTHTIPV